MIIDGLDTAKIYTADEVVEAYRKGNLRQATLRGWFFRFDMSGHAKLVHVSDPTAKDRGQFKTYEIADPLPGLKADVQSDAPIRKRTPQERLASMTTKLMAGARGQEAAAQMLLNMLAGRGGVDGLSDDQVKQIAGASWKAGDPLDGETVRRVAAHYLGAAERAVAEQTRDKNTRLGRKARREQERLEKQEHRAWEKRQRKLEAQHELTKKYL